MTATDLIDEQQQQQQQNNLHNHHNGITRDNPALNEDDDLCSVDKRKPVIMASRKSMENGDGKNCVLSIDAANAKAREVMNSNNDADDDGNLVNGSGEKSVASAPPDGGWRAWSIMVGSFLINGVLFSVINTYSLIYLELQKQLSMSGQSDVSSKAALVGSLTIGTTFLLSPIAGILTDKVGIQLTTFLGGALAAGGMYLSSILANHVEYLYLTYGVMYGLGASLAYTPSLVILGHYFKRHLGFVNGVVTTGSSVFTIMLPYAIEMFLSKFGLEGTLRSLAGLTAVVMLCALLFKPIPLPANEEAIKQKKKFRTMLKETVNTSIWKRKKYVLWALAIPVALFGYFVPYVHIGKFVEVKFQDADKKLPIMCIGITSGIGRLVFGYIADRPKVNRILLQQISFFSIGALTMLLSITTSYPILIVISLCMGLFDGCFISLLGPIAFDICGQKSAAQAIGFLLGMCSLPLTVGPPIAGFIFDSQGSYQIPFLLAGVPPIVGALAMFLVYRVTDDDIKNIDEEVGDADQALTDPKNQNGDSCGTLLTASTTCLNDQQAQLLEDDNKICKNNLNRLIKVDRHSERNYYKNYHRREGSISDHESSPLLKKYSNSDNSNVRTSTVKKLKESDDLILML